MLLRSFTINFVLGSLESCTYVATQGRSHNRAMKIHFSSIAVVGAGAMGQGIAQIAAQAGSHVWLLDSKPGGDEKVVQIIDDI